MCFRCVSQSTPPPSSSSSSTSSIDCLSLVALVVGLSSYYCKWWVSMNVSVVVSVVGGNG